MAKRVKLKSDNPTRWVCPDCDRDWKIPTTIGKEMKCGGCGFAAPHPIQPPEFYK